MFIFNLINQIVSGEDIIERMLYTLPFLIAVILIHIFPFRKNIKALIFLVFAILTHIDGPDPLAFSSAIFFIFAFAETRSIRTGIIVCIATLGTIVYKSSIIGHSNPQALNMVALFAYLYTRSYFTFFKSTELPHIKLSGLTKEENHLLTHIGNGLTQKEAAVEMEIKPTTIAYMIKQIKEKTGYKTLPQLFRNHRKD